MPDIDPAALTRTESFSHTNSSHAVSSKANGSYPQISQKPAKAANTAQRIDIEPLYTSLKVAISDRWGDYKEAISLFVLGNLNQNELSLRTDQYILNDPSREHLHNQLIAAIYGNVPRDLPDQAVAPWVSANDKPTMLSKPLAGDAAEQRLKTEVMQLPARDRRRIKDVSDVEYSDSIVSSMTEYHQAKNIRLPDTVPASAGGLNKTNWDLEIRKRYSQPLAAETGEFPDADTIQGRMVPICYEESLVNGCAAPCSDFLVTATEQYIKEVLSGIYGRTRSNVPASSGSILTQRYKRQLEKEEEACLKGVVFRGQSSGMLPVEIKEALGRKPLGNGDLKLALEVGDCSLGHMPAVVEKIMGSYLDGELDAYDLFEEAETINAAYQSRGEFVHDTDLVNDTASGLNGTEPSIDESDWGWEGGGMADREKLNSILDDCLAIGQ